MEVMGGQEVLESLCSCLLVSALLAGWDQVLCATLSLCPPGPWGSLGFINVNLVNAASSWGVSSVSPRGEWVCSAFCLDAKE